MWSLSAINVWPTDPAGAITSFVATPTLRVRIEMHPWQAVLFADATIPPPALTNRAKQTKSKKQGQCQGR